MSSSSTLINEIAKSIYKYLYKSILVNYKYSYIFYGLLI